jgi:hypothetical protein
MLLHQASAPISKENLMKNNSSSVMKNNKEENLNKELNNLRVNKFMVAM